MIVLLKPIGERSRELISSDNLNYLKREDKEVYVCFLPEMSGEEENYLLKNRNNFLILIFPIGDKNLTKVKESQEILDRISKRESLIVLHEDVIQNYPYFSLKKIIETRNHLIHLFHEVYINDSESLSGKVLHGMSYSRIRYSPDLALEEARRQPWYSPGTELIYSFSKYDFGKKMDIDLNEIFVLTY